MPVRLIERTSDAYAYPLLIKQLLHTPLAVAPDQEITYMGGRRHSYRELRQPGETFIATLRRLGAEPFKQAANGARHVADALAA